MTDRDRKRRRGQPSPPAFSALPRKVERRQREDREKTKRKKDSVKEVKGDCGKRQHQKDGKGGKTGNVLKLYASVVTIKNNPAEGLS